MQAWQEHSRLKQELERMSKEIARHQKHEDCSFPFVQNLQEHSGASQEISRIMQDPFEPLQESSR